MNAAFQMRWGEQNLDDVLPAVVLAPRLRSLLQARLVRNAEVLVLEPLLMPTLNPSDFPDRTGYQALINKFHVEDYIERENESAEPDLGELVRQGVKAAVLLSERLQSEGRYRVLLSLDPACPAMTLRFFALTDGVPWGAGEPNEYTLDEVLMIDTSGPCSGQSRQAGLMEFRVSKYDPELRHSDGRFEVSSWTAISDIGRSFDGQVLTVDEYLATEDAYVEAVRLFMERCAVAELTIRDLELKGDSGVPAEARLNAGLTLVDGQVLSGAELDSVVRLALREVIWCRLESPSGFFVHFGYDFYMYVGTPDALGPPNLSSRLYAEEFRSPYHREA